MTVIDAKDLDYQALNEAIRAASDDITVQNCLGQRFIAAGQSAKAIAIHGTPGNALGAYLNGAQIAVYGNGQDAVGDTMNTGSIVIHGNVGDAVGYAMRGGEIYVRGSAGYRAGIHMKAYQEKQPVMVIGGSCGSFLGEYQAGGVIVVLGMDGGKIVGNFCGTGMHGGKIWLRCDGADLRLPPQVKAERAAAEDLAQIEGYLARYAALFGADLDEIRSAPFTVLTPNSSNPYRQMYVQN